MSETNSIFEDDALSGCIVKKQEECDRCGASAGKELLMEDILLLKQWLHWLIQFLIDSFFHQKLSR